MKTEPLDPIHMAVYIHVPFVSIERKENVDSQRARKCPQEDENAWACGINFLVSVLLKAVKFGKFEECSSICFTPLGF